MQPAKNVTKSALARRLGVGPSAVAKYIRMGMPTLEDGRLDEDVVLAWVAENVDQRMGSDDKGASRARRLTRRTGALELAAERARLVKAQADAVEFKLARERREYVLAADV